VIFVVITVVDTDEDELAPVVDELCAATGRATIASTARTANAHQKRCLHERIETVTELIVEDVGLDDELW